MRGKSLGIVPLDGNGGGLCVWLAVRGRNTRTKHPVRWQRGGILQKVVGEKETLRVDGEGGGGGEVWRWVQMGCRVIDRATQVCSMSIYMYTRTVE